jgi:cytochrome c oxidase subunit IV
MSQPVDSVKTYSLIWIALLILTVATTAVSYFDLGPLNVVTALAIAAFKMLLVALFFMHVRHSSRLTKLVVLGGMLWLGIMLTLTMADIVSRGWLGVPGR